MNKHFALLFYYLFLYSSLPYSLPLFFSPLEDEQRFGGYDSDGGSWHTNTYAHFDLFFFWRSQVCDMQEAL